MALIFWLFMALVPCLLGMGALRILYGSQRKNKCIPADSILVGGILCVGLAEAAHLTAVVFGWSFSHCVVVFVAGLIGAVILALVLVVTAAYPRTESKVPVARGITQYLPWLLFGVLAVMQLVSLMTMQAVYVDGDMTLESVSSFLATNYVYQVNPLTGKPYSPEMPLRLEILCLPTLYAMLSRLFQMDAGELVYAMIPAVVLIGSYLAYDTVGVGLFGKDMRRRGWFLLVTALLLSVGNYMYGMDGFGLLHSGFRGVAIRGGILLPYTFGLMLRRCYKPVILCVAAEACVVWTLYGMGACALVAVGMLLVEGLVSRYVRKQDRGEDALC